MKEINNTTMKTENELVAEFLGWNKLTNNDDTFWHRTEKCTIDP